VRTLDPAGIRDRLDDRFREPKGEPKKNPIQAVYADALEIAARAARPPTRGGL
jgi:hypothetical protein